MAMRKAAKEWKLTRARAMRLSPTKAEAIIWKRVRGDALGLRVRRQEVILGWIVDFYVARRMLVIEIDGGIHSERRRQDARRDSAMVAAGLTILRFTNEEVLQDTDGVIRQISQAIQDLPEVRSGAAYWEMKHRLAQQFKQV